jgi:hypothetical protein
VVLEAFVYWPFNDLMRLLGRDSFIELYRVFAFCVFHTAFVCYFVLQEVIFGHYFRS